MATFLERRAGKRRSSPAVGDRPPPARPAPFRRTRLSAALGKVRRLMASLLVLLAGAFLFALGGWILWLRAEGAVDRFWPSTLTVGKVTIDGAESKGQAEILRARFDLYFRFPRPIASDTGFVEVVTLDAPALLRPKGLDGPTTDLAIEVSGVDVWRLVDSITEIARPPEWLIEADFQTRPDRDLLALRLRRGPHVVRTWYLERLKTQTDLDAALLERLTDDAIFHIVHDFWTDPSDPDLARWRRAIPPPALHPDDRWPNPAAVAAYFRAQGALGRYYQLGDWKDLDAALEDLRTLRVQMPDFPDGLQLLGMALTERGEVHEAIHVYEHLRPLLERREGSGDSPRALSVDLLEAAATAKLQTWQATHRAVRDLTALRDKLRSLLDATRHAALSARDRATLGELHAHCAVQLAQAFALYLEFLQRHTITEVFGSPDAPPGFGATAEELARLRPDAEPAASRRTVTGFVARLKAEHERWLREADEREQALERAWGALADGKRRRNELASRKRLARAAAEYRMAEWERRRGDPPSKDVFGSTYEALLQAALQDLRAADSLHPNHHRVLQLLALATADPRNADADLSVAEQYAERAIRANPFDAEGHELLAGILFRRVARHGLDWSIKPALDAGLARARDAVLRREASYDAQLLRAKLQAAAVGLEPDAGKRRALLAELDQDRTQAHRFMPKVFQEKGDPELAWVDLTAELARLRLEEEALEALDAGQGRARRRALEADWSRLRERTQALLLECAWYEQHWVPNQRVFGISAVGQHAGRLRATLSEAPAPERARRRIQAELL